MSEEGKYVSDEDCNSLIQINERWNALTRLYGELHFRSRRIERDMKEVNEAFEILENDRVSLINKIQTEMGSAGEVDLKTKEFRPLNISK